MRLTVNKVFALFVLIVSLLSSACAQSEKEKIATYNQYAEKAKQLRAQGKLEEAIAEQKKAVEIFPEDADTLAVLAGIYIELNQKDSNPQHLKDAESLLEKAVTLKKDDPVLHKMYSTTLQFIGNKEKALEEMEIAIKLQPDNLDNKINAAIIQKEMGNGNCAKEKINLILRENPNYIYAIYHLAEMEKEDGNTVKAEELFKKVISLQENVEQRDIEYIEESKKKIEEIIKGRTGKAKRAGF